MSKLIAGFTALLLMFSGLSVATVSAESNPTTGSVTISTNHKSGSWTLQKSGGATITTGTGTGENTVSLPVGQYKVLFGKVTDYTLQNANPTTFEIKGGDSVTVKGMYLSSAKGSVTLSTNHGQGSYTLQKSDGSTITTGSGRGENTISLPAGQYKVLFGTVTDYKIQNANPTTFEIKGGDSVTVKGMYVADSKGSVTISTNHKSGSWTLQKSDGSTITTGTGTGENTVSLPVGSYQVSFGTVTGYKIQNANPTTFEIKDGDSNKVVKGIYVPDSSSNTTDTGTVVVNQTGTTGTVTLSGPSSTTITNATYSNSSAKIGSYTVSASAPTGYTVESITDGNSASVTSQTLAKDGTITFNVKYKEDGSSTGKAVKITKSASSTTEDNNNKRVTYTITVERLDDGSNPLTITLTDTITGSGRLTNNNGVLNFVSGGNGIDSQPVSVTLNTKGSTATITYQMLSDNSAQTETATFNNTITANYINPNSNDSESVSSSAGISVNPVGDDDGGDDDGGDDDGGDDDDNNGDNNDGLSPLVIFVSADKSQAKIGENVTYTITAKNISDKDLTGIYVSHQYPTELKVVNNGGGKDDGRAIQFQKPILQPGQSITYKVTVKVASGTAGTKVRSITSAMANEVENLAPVSTYLTITNTSSGGTKGSDLANSGPMDALLISMLAAASYLGYALFRRKKSLIQ